MSDEFKFDDIVAEDLETVIEESNSFFELDVDMSSLDVNFDALDDIDVVGFLDSVGSINVGDDSQVLLLELDDADLIMDIPIEEDSSTSLALRPSESVLAVYAHAENEVAKVDNRNRELSKIMNNINSLNNAVYDKMRAFLDKPIFDIFPKLLRFTTKRFAREGDFRTFIISKSDNMRTMKDVYDAQALIEDVIEVYIAEYTKTEPTKVQLEKIEDALRKFIIFTESIYKESETIHDTVIYKKSMFTEVHCPDAITSDSYLCLCGEEIVMPYNRPPLCFFIRKLGNAPEVRLMNQPVYCPTCGKVLALPELLAEEIEHRGSQYIQKLKASYDEWRIYRPKLDVLETFIPHDAQELFQFNPNNLSVIDASTAMSGTAVLSYKKLINMWMSAEVSKENLTKVSEQLTLSGSTTGTRSLLRYLSKVKLDVVPDLYVYQFTKTVILFLEEFSLFAITTRQKAFYDYCQRDGIKRNHFDVEFANQWLLDNAWAIAGLNNLYDGDTTMEPLGVLPEYEESINFIVALHLLSSAQVINKDSKLGKWIKSPMSNHDFFAAIYEKNGTPSHLKLVTSKRDLVDKTTSFEKLVWSDLYHFSKKILVPVRLKLSAGLKSIALDSLTKTENEFYGEEMDEGFLIRPTLRFEEFKEAFKDKGYTLFYGSHCNELRKNIAKGILLYSKGTDMSNLFLTTKDFQNDITKLLVSSSTEDINNYLFDYILRLASLPGDLNAVRDELGPQIIIDSMDDFKETFWVDEEFMSKFGDVVKCFW